MGTTQTVIAIIPVRGGSQGIPKKNLQPVGGVPLLIRAIETLRAVSEIDQVVVTTDDPQLRELAESVGATTILRPEEFATDTATSESALLHAIETLAATGESPTITVFIQATSPFIRPQDVSDAVRRVASGQEDAVLSVAETHDFLWSESPHGAVAVNHDSSVRLRRQDRDPHYRETGAFYVMNTAGFIAARHRFFGRIGLQQVPAETALEIDTPGELLLAQTLAETVDPRALTIAPDIAAVVTDFDGVHTDDTVHLDQHGTESVVVNRSDGMGVARLIEAGVRVLILSTETNPVVSSRATKLGVEAIQGCEQKGEALAGWIAEVGIQPEQVAYLGNDINDLPCFEVIGWPIAVANATDFVKSRARRVLHNSGGHGAVREVADLVLAARKGTS